MTEQRPTALGLIADWTTQHLAALHAALPGAVSGDDDEGVHNVRVAVRRLRVALGMAQRLADDDTSLRDARRALEQIQDAAAPIRDFEAAIPLADHVPEVQEFLRHAALEARARFAAKITGRRGQRWLRTAGAACLTVPDVVDAAWERAVAGSLERLARDRAESAQVGLAAGDDPALHAWRTTARRYRYTLELLMPLLDTGMPRVLKRLRNLQKELGDQHDCVIAAEIGKEILPDSSASRQWLESVRERAAEQRERFLDRHAPYRGEPPDA